MKKCPQCNRIYKDTDCYCLNDNRRLINYSQKQSFQDQETIQTKLKCKLPKCPTCGSTNIKKISDISRGTHALVFGLFSKTAKSQFRCLNCDYIW